MKQLHRVANNPYSCIDRALRDPLRFSVTDAGTRERPLALNV